MARLLRQAGEASGGQMLYSIKALPFLPVLELLAPWLDGFSVSSLFEARLAAALGKPLHITTPGLREAETAEIGGLCRFVAFNSWQQFQRLHGLLGEDASPGLRVNPGLSLLDDRRHDPCRESSKLGVPLDELAALLAQDGGLGGRLRGLHFHTAFASRSFTPLQATADHLIDRLGEDCLSRLDWINLGGGYLFDSLDDLRGLTELVQGLRGRLGVEVYFEPGKAVAGRAGYLAASVVDRFRRDGKTVLVLDSTVNHHPKLFEYQLRPQPAWAEPEQGESAILAGCTCLAGDLFGEYRFETLPEVGGRVVFADIGAYSLVKANRFNGHNLPYVYAWDGGSGLRKMKSPGFAEYLAQWRAD
jgi:carboxynorspermidine decarboxylase